MDPVSVPVELAPFISVPLIVAATSVFKNLIPDRYLPNVAEALGVAVGVLSALHAGSDPYLGAAVGVTVGWSASGLFAGVAAKTAGPGPALVDQVASAIAAALAATRTPPAPTPVAEG